MEPFSQLGRMLILLGIVAVVAGLALVFADKIPFIGRLPGDIHVRGKGWSVYIPLATTLLLSLLATILLNLFTRR